MKFSSRLIERAIDSFKSFPGVGKKTALRLVLHLVNQREDQIEEFKAAIEDLTTQLKRCRYCGNFSDEEVCSICSDPARKKGIICIVENIRDVMAIEHTQQFNGLYHVLGGVISPVDGVGPEDLNIDLLINRLQQYEVDEIIMAISPTVEGETTIYYLSKELAEYEVEISTIARGVSFGGELEYADEVTLGRSIMARTPYQLSE